MLLLREETATKSLHIFLGFWFCFLFCLLGLRLQHMEVPRLGVKSELQLPAHTTATATPVPGLIFDLHHSARQCRILNPLSEARDQTLDLTVPSRIRFCCATMGTPWHCFKHREASMDKTYKNSCLCGTFILGKDRL